MIYADADRHGIAIRRPYDPGRRPVQQRSGGRPAADVVILLPDDILALFSILDAYWKWLDDPGDEPDGFKMEHMDADKIAETRARDGSPDG